MLQILSMGLWNSNVDCAGIVIHWAAFCLDSNVNLFSLIWSITVTHLRYDDGGGDGDDGDDYIDLFSQEIEFLDKSYGVVLE